MPCCASYVSCTFRVSGQVLCLEAVWKALEDAGLRAEDVYKTRTGIFVGACEYLEDYSEAPDDTNPRYHSTHTSALLAGLALVCAEGHPRLVFQVTRFCLLLCA